VVVATVLISPEADSVSVTCDLAPALIAMRLVAAAQSFASHLFALAGAIVSFVSLKNSEVEGGWYREHCVERIVSLVAEAAWLVKKVRCRLVVGQSSLRRKGETATRLWKVPLGKATLYADVVYFAHHRVLWGWVWVQGACEIAKVMSFRSKGSWKQRAVGEGDLFVVAMVASNVGNVLYLGSLKRPSGREEG
jgi:hypothetical protein